MLHELANQPAGVDLYQKNERKRLTPQWLALTTFLNHPWFTRVWMIQEVAVASHVIFVYGCFSFYWDTLSTVMNIFQDPGMAALLQMTQDGKLA
jgi:hypothetical protein